MKNTAFNLLRERLSLFLPILLLIIFGGKSFCQYQNVRVDSSSSLNAEEVSIALNPINSRFVSAGSNLFYLFRSSDSGLNWQTERMTSQLGESGDPCLMYDGEGNLYYAHLSNANYWLDRIVVQKSTDNGLTWNDGAGIGLDTPKQQDKEWMAADFSSPNYKNNIYISWTQFDKYGSSSPTDSSTILFSRSTDFGTNWSTPVRVSDRAGNCFDSDSTDEGAIPCVGPDGEVYLSWAGPLGIMFDKSFDGGQTFGKDIFVSSQPGGWDFNVSGIYRCNGLPVTACDTSHSIYRGNIYVLWSDQRNGIDNTDVFFSKSTDNGNSWSSPIKVNDDNSNRQQFFPWMTIDEAAGFIYVVFYDRRNTTGDSTDVYLAKSTDGGNSFQNFKICQSSFVPSSGKFFGDYINVAAYNHKIFPVWMRLDIDTLTVWTAPIYDSSGVMSAGENKLMINKFSLEQNYPNPFNPSTKIKFELPRSEYVSLNVYDVLGRLITTLVNGYMIKGIHEINFPTAVSYNSLPSGIYYYRLISKDFSETKKMLLLK